ncbi:rieske domain-containing protein [Cercophora newfieldiana]|uniref:Rieske domain-containing protein n=1 Tax=Cercophora newfieldiana TaxID=92897 RepID=A0AA40CRU9_9PEZI|nr:rieske domain-containing protein [Cercophora newfieldiana]
MSWNPFRAPSRSGGEWFPAGLASDFPDVGDQQDDAQDGAVVHPRPCGDKQTKPGCKVFHVPKEDSSKRTEVAVPAEDDAEAERDMTDQVMVFQYRGKFHAVDHQCPHSSYPLSKGVPFDIEDFGIVLSAGITCPKHSWSFDLFSGRSDRGSYRLKVWEAEVRDVKGGEGGASQEKEVWVRRKPRMG